MMIVQRGASSQAWAILLLAPIIAGMALTSKNWTRKVRDIEIEDDWLDEDALSGDSEIGDPVNSGFDIPIL